MTQPLSLKCDVLVSHAFALEWVALWRLRRGARAAHAGAAAARVHGAAATALGGVSHRHDGRGWALTPGCQIGYLELHGPYIYHQPVF